MKEPWKAGYINRWLTANCLGDHSIRKGTGPSEREFIIFCFLTAQRVCETQPAACEKGNMRLLENSKDILDKLISPCLPYIGAPLSLSAVASVDKAVEQ